MTAILHAIGADKDRQRHVQAFCISFRCGPPFLPVGVARYLALQPRASVRSIPTNVTTHAARAI